MGPLRSLPKRSSCLTHFFPMNKVCTMKSMKFHKQKADGSEKGWADRTEDDTEELIYYQSPFGAYVHSTDSIKKAIIDQTAPQDTSTTTTMLAVIISSIHIPTRVLSILSYTGSASTDPILACSSAVCTTAPFPIHHVTVSILIYN